MRAVVNASRIAHDQSPDLGPAKSRRVCCDRHCRCRTGGGSGLRDRAAAQRCDDRAGLGKAGNHHSRHQRGAAHLREQCCRSLSRSRLRARAGSLVADGDDPPHGAGTVVGDIRQTDARRRYPDADARSLRPCRACRTEAVGTRANVADGLRRGRQRLHQSPDGIAGNPSAARVSAVPPHAGALDADGQSRRRQDDGAQSQRQSQCGNPAADTGSVWPVAR